MKLAFYRDLIFQGAEIWNKWRVAHPKEMPVLDGIELHDLNLEAVDFSGLSIRDADIRRCKFVNSRFISSNLKGSVLIDNDFSKAKFIASTLNYTKISECRFQGATLLTASVRGSQFEDVDLRGQDLQSLNLRELSMVRCNLSGLNLSQIDLSGINLSNSILKDTNLSQANLTRADLQSVLLGGANIKGANFTRTNLSNIDFQGRNLEGTNFSGAILTNCDLRNTNLSDAKLVNADITGAKLWKAHTTRWDISHIRCEFAYWNKRSDEKTKYKKHEFERIYGESSIIELKYAHSLLPAEIATLPIFIEHLEATFWGTSVRLKEVKDTIGGTMIRLAIQEHGKYHPANLKEEMQLEANRIQLAQLAMRNNHSMRNELKEDIAGIKDKFWPRLLELAAENENERARNLTVVFMDLKGFSQWKDGELSEKLSLFRGLVKPVLDKWEASYPNMEGDSLRITFRNTESALSCACMIRDILQAAGFKVRIGVELGEVKVVHNEVTNVSDLEGAAVSMAARLEAIAEPGQIITSEKVHHYTKHSETFEFTPIVLRLSKSIGEKNAGDSIHCYIVDKKLQ